MIERFALSVHVSWQQHQVEGLRAMFSVHFDVYACNWGWHQDASSKELGTQSGSSVFDTVALLEHPY